MSENTERRGVIEDVIGSGSIFSLVIRRDNGEIERVLAENPGTVRALIQILGTDIVRGHSLNVDRVKGLEISYDTDDLGLLAYIGE